MSFISLQRILRIASKLKQEGGEIDQFEISTLKYLFGQCNQKQKEHILNKYGEELEFLKEEKIEEDILIWFD